jgi:hypothetical protein
LFKVVKKEYGDLGKSRIKLIVKEEEKVQKILEQKVRKIMQADDKTRKVVKETNVRNLYNPLKDHIYFKVSYVYLKKFLSKIFH